MWHGTAEEASALNEALANNCTCKMGIMGMRESTCPPHQAFVSDQGWLDHLIYLRRYWVTHGGELETQCSTD